MMSVACLFPGQGSQFVGMGKKLCAEHVPARLVFEEADDSLQFSLSKLCFDGPESELTRTEFTQPAILTHSTALFRVLQAEEGLVPNVVAGHSLGEYSALVAAKALKFPEAVQAVRKRGQWMQEAVPTGEGGMLALLGTDEVQANIFCEEVLQKYREEFGNASGPVIFSVANLNGGEQVVVAGHQRLCTWAVEHAAELTSRPRKLIPLNVSAPFHCALMKPAEEKLKTHLETLSVSALSCPYLANVDAELHEDVHGVVPRLVAQVCAPVRWEASMRALLASQRCEAVWEVGPGKVLTGLWKRIDKNFPVEAKGSRYDV